MTERACSASATAAGLSSQHPRCSRPVRGRRRASSPQYPRSPARARRKWVQVEQVVDDRRQTQQRAVSACGAPQCGQCHMTNHIVAAHATVRHALPHPARGSWRPARASMAAGEPARDFCHVVPTRVLVTGNLSRSHQATGWQRIGAPPALPTLGPSVFVGLRRTKRRLRTRWQETRRRMWCDLA